MSHDWKVGRSVAAPLKALNPRRSRTAPLRSAPLRKPPPANPLRVDWLWMGEAFSGGLRGPSGTPPPFGSCEGRALARPEQYISNYIRFDGPGAAASDRRASRLNCPGLTASLALLGRLQRHTLVQGVALRARPRLACAALRAIFRGYFPLAPP